MLLYDVFEFDDLGQLCVKFQNLSHVVAVDDMNNLDVDLALLVMIFYGLLKFLFRPVTEYISDKDTIVRGTPHSHRFDHSWYAACDGRRSKRVL